MEGRDDSSRGAQIHWSKDFVEHVRTVHFAVVALCTALIILSVIPTRTHAKKALQQLGALQSIRSWYSPQKICDAAQSVVQTHFQENNTVPDSSNQSMGAALAEEAKKGNDPIEAFGIKLPAEQVSVWGVILVLAGELYLYLHLRELWGKISETDAGWDVPWIGVYQSRLARACYCFTLVVLPTLAVLMVTLRARSAAVSDHSVNLIHLYDASVVVTTLAVGFIAVATWRIAPKRNCA